MEAVSHDEPQALSNRANKWLFQNEAINNGFLSILDLLKKNSTIYSRPFWFGTIEKTSQVVGAALHVKPDGLVVTDVPDSAASSIFDSVHQKVGAPHRILAPKLVGEHLAVRWANECELELSEPLELNSNCLETLISIETAANGHLRLGNERDVDLVTQWGVSYNEEKPAPVDVAKFLTRKLRRGELYLWDDNKPTTVLTVSGSTTNGIRISSVFTPRNLRSNGYATTAVAKLSNDLLNQGKRYVVLVTRKRDSSERIYRRLGYKKIAERVCFNLNPLLSEPD